MSVAICMPSFISVIFDSELSLDDFGLVAFPSWELLVVFVRTQCVTLDGADTFFDCLLL